MQIFPQDAAHYASTLLPLSCRIATSTAEVEKALEGGNALVTAAVLARHVVRYSVWSFTRPSLVANAAVLLGGWEAKKAAVLGCWTAALDAKEAVGSPLDQAQVRALRRAGKQVAPLLRQVRKELRDGARRARDIAGNEVVMFLDNWPKGDPRPRTVTVRADGQ